MQRRTIIFNTENWALGENPSKDVMLWAIKDMPWLQVKTFGNLNITKFPAQFKNKSWLDIEINETAQPSDEIINLTSKISKRMTLLQDLNYLLEVSQENIGIKHSNFNILDFYKYLSSKNIINGQYEEDSEIKFENIIQILSHLDEIKKTIIQQVLKANNEDEYKEVKIQMDRLFFTNILL